MFSELFFSQAHYNDPRLTRHPSKSKPGIVVELFGPANPKENERAHPSILHSIVFINKLIYQLVLVPA